MPLVELEIPEGEEMTDAEMDNWPETHCIQCQGPPAEPHPCPSLLRYYNDAETLCNCCEKCAGGCG